MRRTLLALFALLVLAAFACRSAPESPEPTEPAPRAEPQPLVNLDDVTNGLVESPAANPAAGVFFNEHADGDYRGRTENLFDAQLGLRLSNFIAPDLILKPAGAEAEEYDPLFENRFRHPRALSTFGIDVDTAAYANVRRILGEGRLPPREAVRIEEMLNSFSYGDAEPADDVPFAVTTEVAECPWNARHRVLRIGIRGRRQDPATMPPRNLVFLLDVSGSMSPADKLPLVKDAMEMLARTLGPADSVAIVVYAGATGVVLPATPGDDLPSILGALDRLDAGGSTNGGDGIRAAYSLARESFRAGAVNRVILATDGDFNVGVTDRAELLALIEEERESGVFLTVLGVGTGNLKDSDLEQLADHGNGNYHYLDSRAEARRVLVEEAGGTLVTIAKDVKIQVAFHPDRVGAYRLIGYENRVLAAEDFDDDRVDAGEIGAGASVTAIYEIAPPGEAPETGPVADGERSDFSFTDELALVRLRYKEPDGDESRLLEVRVADPGNVAVIAASDDFRFAAAVATFGLVLRESEHRADASLPLARQLAHGALGEDPHGHRRAFLELTERCQAQIHHIR